jgi:hypothetical protein
MKKISKRVRREAARIASMWASTPSWRHGIEGHGFGPSAVSLYSKAFYAAYKYEGRPGEHPAAAAAEAESLLRCGWSPS